MAWRYSDCLLSTASVICAGDHICLCVSHDEPTHGWTARKHQPDLCFQLCRSLALLLLHGCLHTILHDLVVLIESNGAAAQVGQLVLQVSLRCGVKLAVSQHTKAGRGRQPGTTTLPHECAHCPQPGVLPHLKWHWMHAAARPVCPDAAVEEAQKNALFELAL